MADIFKLDDEQQKEWEAWLDTRPPKIRELAEKYPPWKLYRLTSSGHRVTVMSMQEPIEEGEPTFTVAVTAKYNRVAFERAVFGIPPSDLVECDLPAPDEVVGVREDGPTSLDEARVSVRPDLWAMDDKGKAHWIGPGERPNDP